MIRNYFSILLGMVIMFNAQSAEFKQPEFTLELSVTGIGVDVKINDISIEFDAMGGHSTMTYDVNESVISGINELKVIVFPYFEEHEDGIVQSKQYHDEAEVKATLLVNEKGEKQKIVLSQIFLKPSLPLNSDVVVNSNAQGKMQDVVLDDMSQPISFPGIVLNKQIVATQKSIPVQKNHPRWEWQDGKEILNTKENFDSLLTFYKEIYNAYKANDKMKLLEYYDHAASEFSVAYYLKGGKQEGHKFIETGDVLDNPEFELYDFYTEDVKLDIFANGKLARIIDAGFYHPVVFVHKTKDLIYTLKFGFYKNKQNEWVMIR